MATATLRKVGRDLAALASEARLPSLPDPSVFGTADEQTRQLVLIARRGEPMRALHRHSTWVPARPPTWRACGSVFEAAGPSDLFAARAARHAEEHAPSNAAAVAAE